MTNTAVIGVDPQNDFGHPSGALYCTDGFKVVGGGMILFDYANKNGWAIMLSADWHPLNSEHFTKWPPHCVQHTWGAKFLPGIDQAEQVFKPFPFIFYKGTRVDEDGYDPFDGKMENRPTRGGDSMEDMFNACDVKTLVVWGIATNYCVRAFVLTAREKGYKVHVALNACAAVPTPENPPADFITEEQAIEEMKAAGAIMTTVEEVVSGKLS